MTVSEFGRKRENVTVSEFGRKQFILLERRKQTQRKQKRNNTPDRAKG